MVAISSNEVPHFPEDVYERIKAFAVDRSFPFPYLYDVSQDVALAYGAISTPDFFLYAPGRTLYYADHFDASRPKSNRLPLPSLSPLRTHLPVTGEDLRRATDDLLAGEAAPQPQSPYAGCSMKWLPGKSPSWG